MQAPLAWPPDCLLANRSWESALAAVSPGAAVPVFFEADSHILVFDYMQVIAIYVPFGPLPNFHRCLPKAAPAHFQDIPLVHFFNRSPVLRGIILFHTPERHRADERPWLLLEKAFLCAGLYSLARDDMTDGLEEWEVQRWCTLLALPQSSLTEAKNCMRWRSVLGPCSKVTGRVTKSAMVPTL